MCSTSIMGGARELAGSSEVNEGSLAMVFRTVDRMFTMVPQSPFSNWVNMPREMGRFECNFHSQDEFASFKPPEVEDVSVHFAMTPPTNIY